MQQVVLEITASCYVAKFEHYSRLLFQQPAIVNNIVLITASNNFNK